MHVANASTMKYASTMYEAHVHACVAGTCSGDTWEAQVCLCCGPLIADDKGTVASATETESEPAVPAAVLPTAGGFDFTRSCLQELEYL